MGHTGLWTYGWIRGHMNSTVRAIILQLTPLFDNARSHFSIAIHKNIAR